MKKITRIILTNTPLQWIIKKSRDWYPRGFGGHSFYEVMGFFRNQLNWQGLIERASAISYNTIMALPPSLLFLFTVIPTLPFIPKESIKIQLHEIIYDVIPAKVHNKEIITFVDQFMDNTKIGLLSFGFILSLFFASNATMGLIRSFNRDYIGFKKRKGLKKRWIALKITFIIFALLLGYLFLLIMQGKVLDLLVQDENWKTAILYSRWLLIFLLIYSAIAFTFRYAPAVDKKWGFVSPGAILTTSLSVIASIGFSLFVNNFGRYNALYGAIGSIMVLMAFVYINSLSLLIGFELNVSINSLKTIRDDDSISKEESKAFTGKQLL